MVEVHPGTKNYNNVIFTTNDKVKIVFASSKTSDNYITGISKDLLPDLLSTPFVADMNLIISSCFYNFKTNKFVEQKLFEGRNIYNIVIPATNGQIIDRLFKCLMNRNVYKSIRVTWVYPNNEATYFLLMSFFSNKKEIH